MHEIAGDGAHMPRFNDDSIGGAVEGAEVNAPARAYEGTAAEQTAGVIALVVADNLVPGGKAARHELE